jgi:hypothetical protein
MDPGFRQGIVDTIVEQRIDFNNKFAQYSWDMPAERPYHYAPNGDIFNVPWPLPENLTYTNADLLTVSSTGGPLGDPRWFPESTGVNSPESNTDLNLLQNYPNPFSTYTEISFKIINAGMTTLNIYNIQGQIVKSLVNQVYLPGTYKIRFSAEDLRSGVYFYKMQSNGYVSTKKMIIQK